jgi:cysteine desulfurase family protein
MEKIAYFDNAATTYPKPNEVYDFADKFYRQNGASIGRSKNALSLAAGEVGRVAKENLKRIYQCENKCVVFTSSATISLNMILLGLGLTAGSNVYITPFEHNAVTRPLFHLIQSVGINEIELKFSKDALMPDWDSIRGQFEEKKPDLVVMTHASNVCGVVIPVLDIARMAKEYSSTVVVDMSQTAGLIPLNLSSDLIDFAVFAGHKTLFAPDGIGGFFCRRSAHLDPVLFGGNGINSIEQAMPNDIVSMAEIGSRNVYAIAGLAASTNWIINETMEKIFQREVGRRKELVDLLSSYSNIELIGNASETPHVGIVSALFDGYSPDEIESVLSRCGVAVRSGLHCSPYAHRFLSTLPAGTVRFSVSSMTTQEEFDVLKSALDLIESES